MASENILKSYLMSIGFKIDEEGYKKFKDKQEESDKRVKALGENLERFASIAAASATVLTASVIKITDRLTQLYYSSQVANSSARNLQAFKSAAEQVGVSADGAAGAVEGMAMALRNNPQLGGLLQSFNINPNQDKVQVLLELVDRLQRLPFYQASQYAGMFGIDSQTLLMLELHRDELRKYYEQYQKLNEQTNKQSEASRRFHQHLQDLENRFNKLWEIISTRLLPVGEWLIRVLDHLVDFFIEADKVTNGWSSRLLGVTAAIVSVVSGLQILKGALSFLGIGGAAESAGGLGALGALAGYIGMIAAAIIELGASVYFLKKAYDFYNLQGDEREKMHLRRLELLKKEGMLHPNDEPELQRLRKKYDGNAGGADTSSSAPIASVSSDLSKGDLVSYYAAKYDVDPSLMRALVHQEHGTDKQGNPLVSRKGAIGVMQLMPKTAKALGVDPWNPEANIEGGTHLMADLLKKYSGNVPLALAAYNAGSGAVDRYGGVPPFAETQKYVRNILAYQLTHSSGPGSQGPKVLIQQQTKIDVSGTGDPAKVAQDVLAGQERVNKDLQRNVTGVVDR